MKYLRTVTFSLKSKASRYSKRRKKETFKRRVVSVMSVGAVKKYFWQSTSRSTIRERCKSIFNQDLLSDVKFVVRDSKGGSESKNIPAHKFVLAISSPVFYAMFYGQLAETKDSVEISDCEYESLLKLFRFIYSDEANLTPDNVMQLMYLANKYMLPSLADKCATYLKENLDASNVFIVLPEVQKYDEKDLLDQCWKVIEKETGEAVKSDGFVTIERSVLEEMVENDSLNIKEVELFKAVDRWAGKECEKQGVVAEGSVKRRILGERIVKGIRFPAMEQKEFASVVLECDILSKKEVYHLVRYFSSVLDTSVGFCETKRAGSFAEKISRFGSFATGWHNSGGWSACLGLTVDKNIKLHAIRLFGSDSSEYSVTLNVYNWKTYVQVAIKTGSFSSELMECRIGDYHGFEIEFEPSVALEASARYQISASITGPPSWYGQGGVSSVESSGVKFTFWNTQTGQTTVLKGQFAEFVFSLD